MRQPMRTNRLAAIRVCVCLLAALLIPGSALAQWAFPVEQQWKSNITESHLEAFIEHCELSDEQANAARTLLSEHQARFEAFVKSYRETINAISERVDVLGRKHDFSTADSAPQAAREAYYRGIARRGLKSIEAVERQRELDRRILRQWRDLLDDDQHAQCWQSFDAWRLRELLLDRGAAFADERLDLIEIIDELRIDVDAVVNDRGRRPLRLLLDAYERDLHRALTELLDALRSRMVAMTQDTVRKAMQRVDLSDLGEMPDDPYADGVHPTDAFFRPQLEARHQIARVNSRYHRDISAWIPEESIDDYMDMVRRRRGRPYYTGQYAAYETLADRIDSIDDLSETQGEHLARLRAAYMERWRSAVDRTLDARDATFLATIDGSNVQETRRDVSQAEQRLLEIQARGIEDLLGLLTDDQRTRITVPAHPDPRADDR